MNKTQLCNHFKKLAQNDFYKFIDNLLYFTRTCKHAQEFNDDLLILSSKANTLSNNMLLGAGNDIFSKKIQKILTEEALKIVNQIETGEDFLYTAFEESEILVIDEKPFNEIFIKETDFLTLGFSKDANFILQNIRQLLQASFSEDELSDFCLKNYFNLFASFTMGQTKEQRIRAIVNYLNNAKKLHILMLQLFQRNEALYQKYSPYTK